MRFSELQMKEFVNLQTGKMIGYAKDALVNIDNGTIQHIIVEQNRQSILKWGSETENFQVSMDEIEVIGKDVVLVRIKRSN